MQAPVFIVIGYPHHGKTEARKILSELTFLKGESTSTIIYSFLAQRGKTSIDELRQVPKDVFRDTLIEAGDFLVGLRDTIAQPAVDEQVDKDVYRIPSALIRTLYVSGYNVIDGVRRKSELVEAVNHLTWNGIRSVVIWVERPGVEKIVDNTELTAEDATDIVYNNGTLEDLKAELQKVLEKHFGKQDKEHAPLPVFDNDGNIVLPNLEAQVAAAQK